MLDLHTEAVTGWLQAIQPARTHADWPPPVRPVEETAPDDLFEELREAIEGHQSDNGNSLAVALNNPKVVAALRSVLAQLGGARMLRIVAALSDVLPDGKMARLHNDLRDPTTADGRALGAALDAMAQISLRGRLTARHALEALAAAITEQPAQENP